MKYLPLLQIPFLLFLQQCSPSSGPEKNDFSAFYQEGLPADLALTSLPVVKSPSLQKRWGKPKVAVLPDGSYRLSYVHPRESFETLDIYVRPGPKNTDGPTAPPYGHIGFDEKTKSPVPQKSPQEWDTVTILGKPVHAYCDYAGDGADPASYSTITFTPEKAGAPVFNLTVTATSNIAGETAYAYMDTVSY